MVKIVFCKCPIIIAFLEKFYFYPISPWLFIRALFFLSALRNFDLNAHRFTFIYFVWQTYKNKKQWLKVLKGNFVISVNCTFLSTISSTMRVVGDVVSKNCFYDSSQNLLANEIFIVCSSITLFFDLYQIFDPHCHRSSSSPLPIHMYGWVVRQRHNGGHHHQAPHLIRKNMCKTSWKIHR